MHFQFLIDNPNHEYEKIIVSFTRHELEKLKKRVVERMKVINHEDQWCSTNEALTCYIYNELLDTLKLPQEDRYFKCAS